MTSEPQRLLDPAPVLIVDDRAENLLALEAVLEPLDVRVVRASSGAEAVSRCTEEEFAVVVLDVMMPGADGLETARHLKARGASRLTPIVFLTAVDNDRRRVHDGYASGAVDYLFKPVDPDLLRAKVSAFVEMYRHRQLEQWQQRRRYADQAAAAAAAVREGDERFRLLAESVPAMVWTATPDGRIDSINEFGARYTGASRDQIDRRRWSEHVHPDDLAETRRAWGEAVRTGATYEAEVRIWSDEAGAYRRHIARAAPRRAPSGAVLGWIGVNADVEESKRAEEEAHELQLTAEREARIAADDARVELARALDRIARLQALTAALSEAATPGEVAHAVAVNGVAALGASAGSVATLQDSGEENAPATLQIVEAVGYPADVVERWRTIPLDSQVPLARAVLTGRPVLVRDAADRASQFPATPGEPAVFRAAYALPLVAHGSVLGAMGLSFAQTPVLSAEDQALAEAIARQCAQALHRAQLFAAERQAREEAETERRRVAFLSDAGEAVNESLDYRETLQALADAPVPFLADYVIVDMLNPEGHLERLAVAHEHDALRARLAESAAYVRGGPDPAHPTHAALLDGRPRLIADLDDATMAALARNEAHLEILRAVSARSLMAVPLRTRERSIGVVIFGRSDADRRYTAADLRLAQDLVRRASVAIETARLYEEAQEANRAKASFLAAVSHDLRQPLNASLGFLDIALMGIRGDVGSTLREDLERVRRNQQHLLALINDVLSFARVEAGQLTVRREVVPLHQVLEVLPALVSPQADAKGIILSLGSCSTMLNVLGDGERILQIFTNLLTNAIKATPSGGSVTVTCEAAGEIVLAHVRDNGIGIPADQCDRIFEPFVQVSRSLSRPQDGIGLGLAISRNLARAMGGELTVESTLGAGSVFTVRLPRAPVPTPALPLSAVTMRV